MGDSCGDGNILSLLYQSMQWLRSCSIVLQDITIERNCARLT